MAFHYIIFGRSFLLLACITCLFGYKVTALDTTIQGLKNTSITETTIVVQWAESSFTNFTVSYTNGSTKVEKNVTSNIWKIENLLPGVNYNITVSSWNATYSGPGSTISVTTLPSVVTGLKASNASTHAVDVSWNTPSDKNENTYTYNLVVQGPRGKNQTNVKGNITEVPNLEPGTYYNFTVSAVTNNGVSSNPSDVANVTTLPSVVTGLKASNASTHAVDVSWNTPSDPNVNTYTYNLVVQGPHGKNQTNVKGNMTTVQNLEPGTYYSFTVSAVTNNGVSSNPSDADNATTLPSVVTGLKVSNISTNEVTVSWNTSSDPNENTYSYSLVVQGPRWKNITYVQGNSTVVQNLEPGTVYNFTISAVTNNNVSSKPSEVVSATTLPSAVTGLKVSNVSTNAVTVSWNTSSDPNENTYSYSLVVQGWGNKIDVQGNSTFVQNLEPGTVYNFTVSAVTNNNVSSKPSEVVSATTWPSIVTGLNISNISTEEVTVSWNTTGDPNGNTYTYILKVQGPHFVKEIKVIGNNTIVNELDPGTDYNFTVSAVTNNNVSSKPSDVVSATTSPSIVENFTVIDKTNQSFFLNWTMPNNTYVSTYTYTVELWSNGTHNGTFSNIKDHFKQVDYLLAGETYNITIYTVTINGIRSFQNPIIMDTTLPNEPQSLSVNATDITEIFIDWMSPRDVHASLYEYIVEWNNVNLIGKQGQNTTRDTQFNIKSLYPGNLYKITVTSVFKNTFSIQAVENVQTNPVSAQNFIVLTTTNTTATLQWDQPNYDNSKVDGYRVIGWKNGNSLVYNETTKKQTFVVDGLQPGYIYKFSVESFARNEIPPKKRSLSQMDLNWISYSIPKTATGETVPDAVLNPTCSKVDGYQIKVEFRCPLGNYSQIQVLVNNKRYNRSCPGSDKISDLQPAQEYAVKIITFGTDKSADTIITCYTDSTGVIVGSVLGILLFLLLIGLIVFFVFRKRRSKSNSEHIQISTRRRRFHTITKERFKQHYDNNHANSDLGFAEEYQELSSVGILQSKKAAELSDNKAKNRFTNVLPYDHSRVKLITINDTANTDYINANFMPGYNSTKEFIASQGPLPNTTADFWRMVWEHHVNTIVMLTNCMENGRVKCERYWPLDYTPCTYGDITVTVTSETILPEWTTRDFSIKHANQTGLHNVRHFHFTAWPDHGVPDSTSSIMQFRNLVREYMDQRRSNGPTVVHCSAGVGRTGTLIALDYLIQQMEREHRIGVFSCVEKMRMNRGLMVQTEEQYIFLNKCLLDLIEQPPEENIYENQVPTDLIYENATAIRNFQRENA